MKMTCKEITQQLRTLSRHKESLDALLNQEKPKFSSCLEVKHKIEGLFFGELVEIVDLAGEIEVRKIFGKDFFGSAEVAKAFGIKIEKKNIPVIPFPEELLKKAKEMDCILILRAGKLDHAPVTCEKLLFSLNPDANPENFWFDGMQFFTLPLQTSWAIVSKAMIPESLDQNYLDQKMLILSYLMDMFSAIPEGQWSDQYKGLTTQYADGTIAQPEPILASESSVIAQQQRLKINRNTRHTPVEALYDEFVYRRSTGKSLFGTNDFYLNTLPSESESRLMGIGFSEDDDPFVFEGSRATRVGAYLSINKW